MTLFLNTGFTFKNTKGTYKIERQSQGASDFYYVYGKHIDDRMIVSTYEYGLNTIYTNADYPDESVALRFAGINISKDKEIIDFCNSYGLLYTNLIDSENTNDYLFFNSERDSFPKPTSAIGGSCIPVYDFQRDVIKMRKVLLLYDALNNNDFLSIISVLTWFCFDASEVYDDEELQSNYESMRFNDAFREFVDRVEDDYMPEECKTLTQKIALFLQALEDDLHQSELSESTNGIRMYNIEYPDMYHCTWEYFHDLFSRLLRRTDILTVDPLGDVSFSKDLSASDLDYVVGDNNRIMMLGKAFLSDYFSNILMWVHPDMTFENGQFLPNLRISSLLEAMYVELFFKITPYTHLRKCANPTCNAFFEVSSDNSKKMYCSTRCAQLMAKRKQRSREKSNSDKEAE